MNSGASNPMVVHVHGGGSARATSFGFRTDDHPGLDRIQNGISLVAGIIAGALIVAMTVLTCCEVFSRLVLGQPLGWNVSFTERFLLVGIAFFGMVTAYRTGAHVAVTSIFEQLPRSIQKPLQIATHVIVAIVFALLFWFGLQATLGSAALGEIPPIGATELSIPEWIWRSFVPIGSGMGLVIALIDFYREITAPWSVLATDYDPGETYTEAEQ